MDRFWQVLAQKGPYFLATLLGGLETTLAVAAGAMVFALGFGLVIALMRLSRLRLLRWPAIAYIEFIPGTPAPAQLFVIYFGLPHPPLPPAPLPPALVPPRINPP